MKGIRETFDRVDFPVVAINSTDDDWATPASRDAFMTNYRNAQLQLETIQPDGKNQKSIGHMGYFKSHSEALWQRLFDWVHEQSMQSST
jgi:predicted alpha/beta hydrolase